MLASSLPGGPSRPTPEVGSARETGTVPTPGTMVLHLNKYTLAQTHKGGGGGWGGSARSPFHADLLSLSNVWYAGTLALLADLISMGLPEPRARVCTLSSAREPFLWIRHPT